MTQDAGGEADCVVGPTPLLALSDFNAAVGRCAAAAVRLRSWIYTVYTHCTHARGLIFIPCLFTLYTHEGPGQTAIGSDD